MKTLRAMAVVGIVIAGCDAAPEASPAQPLQAETAPQVEQAQTGAVSIRIVNNGPRTLAFDARYVTLATGYGYGPTNPPPPGSTSRGGKVVTVASRQAIPPGGSHEVVAFTGAYGTDGRVEVSAVDLPADGSYFRGAKDMGFVVGAPQATAVFTYTGAAGDPVAAQWAP